MELDTMISLPFNFGLITIVPLSAQSVGWSSLDWKVDSSWNKTVSATSVDRPQTSFKRASFASSVGAQRSFRKPSKTILCRKVLRYSTSSRSWPSMYLSSEQHWIPVQSSIFSLSPATLFSEILALRSHLEADHHWPTGKLADSKVWLSFDAGIFSYVLGSFPVQAFVQPQNTASLTFALFIFRDLSFL